MKPIQNFDTVREEARFSASEKLPAGGYEAEIKNVQWNEGKNGNSDYLVILYDITAGENKDFFKKQYDANTSDDKKWKGRTTIYIPKEDGTEKDEWTKKAFARWINAIEDSNPGYRWDWEEAKLKGKAVGLIYGEVGTIIEGREIVYTECRFPASIAEIKNEKFKIPNLKAKNGYGERKNEVSADGFINLGTAEAEEIPFN